MDIREEEDIYQLYLEHYSSVCCIFGNFNDKLLLMILIQLIHASGSQVDFISGLKCKKSSVQNYALPLMSTKERYGKCFLLS